MLIKVKVWPSSKSQEIIKKSVDSFEVKVKARPIQGQANQETIKVLASYFKVAQSEVKLIRGFQQRNKIFEIKDYE